MYLEQELESLKAVLPNGVYKTIGYEAKSPLHVDETFDMEKYKQGRPEEPWKMMKYGTL